MPITQDRFIETIDAGLDYMKALHEVTSLITELTIQADTHPDLYALLQEIKDITLNYERFMSNPRKSHYTILKEKEYFATNALRNKRHASAIRNRRGLPQPDKPVPSDYDSVSAFLKAKTAKPLQLTERRQFTPLETPPDQIPPHILARAAAFDARDNRRREILREAEALRADILSRAAMIMNQRNVTLETVQLEAQVAYDEYITEQTEDTGFGREE